MWGCPEGYAKAGSEDCVRVNRVAKSRLEAELSCQADGGKLAQPQTAVDVRNEASDSSCLSDSGLVLRRCWPCTTTWRRRRSRGARWRQTGPCPGSGSASTR